MDEEASDSRGPYPANRLKELRESRGLSQGKLAAMMVPPSSAQMIGMLEAGKRELTLGWMIRLGEVLGVQPREFVPDFTVYAEPGKSLTMVSGNRTDRTPDGTELRYVRVMGQVQGGTFRDHPEWSAEEQYTVPYSVRPALQGLPLFGVKVVGPSVNREFPEGSVAICVRLLDLGESFEIQSGRFVVVYRRNGMGEIEATIKQYVIENGEAWLWPRSDHPSFQTPIRVSALVDSSDDDANDDVRIWAVVVGKTQDYPL